LGHSVVKVAWS